MNPIKTPTIAVLIKPIDAFGLTWPVGTKIYNFYLHVRYGYCGELPDGHYITHIMPDDIQCDEEIIVK